MQRELININKEIDESGADYEKTLEIASNYLIAERMNEHAKIQVNFELGLLLSEKKRTGRYGDCVIKRLARDITVKINRPVSPARLYECIDVVTRFKSIDEVWELEETEEISWFVLVRNKHLRAKSTNGDDDGRADGMGDQLILPSCSHEEREKQYIAKHSGILDALKAKIDSDELNCKSIPIDARQIHVVIDIDAARTPVLRNTIIISESTHQELHDKLHKPHEVQRIIDQRNIKFLTEYLLREYPSQP